MIKNKEVFPVSAMTQPALAWLRVTGEDAQSFLQGQFTQDLRVTREQAAVYGLWLNQKGKLLADSQVLLAGPEEVYLWSEATSEATILARLEAYIIADDVVVEPQADRWVRTTVAGAGATDWVAARVTSLPAEGCFGQVGEGWVFRGRHGALDSWEWLTPVGKEPDTAGLAKLEAVMLTRARVAAAVPLIPVEVGAEDLPNEAGLEIEAISYTKGCYLGQEVVVRLKSRGRVRRRLVRVSGLVEVSQCPATLWQGEKAVGELRVTVASDDRPGAYQGLAMVNLFNLDAQAGLALSADGEACWRVEDAL